MPFLIGTVVVLAGAVVLSTVHGALVAADVEEEADDSVGRRADEEAVEDVPTQAEEAVLAEAAHLSR